MKLRIAFLMLLSSAITLSAQSRYRAAVSDEPHNRFLIGLAPISALTPGGKINLRTEFAYAHNKTLSLIVGLPKKTKLPSFLENWIEIKDDADNVQNESFKAVGGTLENRFYLGSTAPRGFYLAPYLRYNRFTLTQTSKGSTDGYETNVSGAIGGLGIGGAAGAQFRLGGPITMDITFLGLDLKWMRGTLTYSSNNPDNDVVAFRDKIVEKLKDIPIIGSKLADQIDGDQVRVRTPSAPLPGFRFNVTVNYAF